MKECVKCKEHKELEKFDKNKNYSDGRTSNCKDCINKRRTERRREKGIPTLAETQKIRGLKQRGENNPNWKGGNTTIQLAIRNSIEYNEWRRKCFIRDRFTCQITGQKGGNLVVHHLKPFAVIVNDIEDDWREDEELFDINNGVTLTYEIHKKFHNIYGKKGFTIENFEEFKNNFNT